MKVKPAKKSGEVILEINRRDEPLLKAATVIPFRLNKVLVPVDFSACSKKALQYALPLARVHHAKVTILYVLPNFYSAGDLGGYQSAEIEEQMRIGAEQELEKFVKDEMMDDTIKRKVQVGRPTTEIIKVAKNLPADLLIISTHGYTGLKHVLLGSVTEQIVRHAPCPVLVVKEHERDLEITETAAR